MKRFPTVTAALVLANAAAYLVELGSGVEPFCQAHGLVPERFARSGDLGPVFAAMFLHAGLAHLAGNMACLAVFGTLVERAVGPARFLCVYLAAGFAGGLLHVLVDPAATDALVGASGAIFGVLAVAAVARPRLIGFTIGFAAINVWYALAGTGGAVSFGDHLGGLMVGALFALAAKASGGECLEAA